MSPRIALATLLAGALLLPTAGTAQEPLPPVCVGADVRTSAETSASGAAAVRCLLDAERRARGLPAHRPTKALETAASRHARDQVAQGYFSHVSKDGRTLCTRVRATGYLKGSKRRYHLGETMVFGINADSTPARLVANLLASSAHRRLLLHRDFREVGIGLAAGVPIAGDTRTGGTVVIDLGRRVKNTQKQYKGTKTCQSRSK